MHYSKLNELVLQENLKKLLYKFCIKNGKCMEKNSIHAVISLMTRMKVLVAAFFGTLVYVFISVGFGPEGFWAVSQLEEQKQMITANLQSIQQINDGLKIEFQGLRVDPDVIAAYAKKLGYKKENEKLIRLQGLSSQTEFVPETGNPVTLGKINYIPEWLCKVSGLCIFCFFMAIFAMQDLRKKLQQKRTVNLYYENTQRAF